MKLEPGGVGRGPRTFNQQMTLEQIDPHTFRSTFGSCGEFPVKDKGRLRYLSYGGHVLAQSVWAAAQTVDQGFIIHSVTGYFLSAAWTDVPFVYKVQTIRNGRSYVTRRVDVTQEDCDGLCYTCTCSFKTPEPFPLEFQDTCSPEENYKSFLNGKKPQDGPELIYTDFLKLIKFNDYGYTSSMPSTKIGILPMEELNKPRAPLDRRHLCYYSVEGTLPPPKEAPNLHACNHLYLSDQMSTTATAKHLDIEANIISALSLSATIVFHSGPENLAMHDEAGNERWFCRELWTDRLADGRATQHSRTWDDKGRHIATTYQDLQMRVKMDSKGHHAKLKGFVPRGSKM